LEVKSLALVVDDEPGILRFVKISLQTAGFDVIATSNAVDALQLARSGTPDILILDLYMEPMTGFDVLRELRTFSLLPVVIITAHQEAAEMALEQGANGLVAKPFNPRDLIREIRRVLKEESDL
jgi:two-component system, OmpR family, KDP operon response regulator KdpE